MEIKLKSRYLKICGLNNDNDSNIFTGNDSNYCGGDDQQAYNIFSGTENTRKE